MGSERLTSLAATGCGGVEDDARIADFLCGNARSDSVLFTCEVPQVAPLAVNPDASIPRRGTIMSRSADAGHAAGIVFPETRVDAIQRRRSKAKI